MQESGTLHASDTTGRKSRSSPQCQRVLRIAHLTDVHVHPDKVAEDGMARAFEHVSSLQDKPDFILNGGDCILDALNTSRDMTIRQWHTWHGILDTSCRLPLINCIGNHDIWGWNQDHRSSTTEGFGKSWAMDELQLTSPYYSFDRAGWHFIVLDSSNYTDPGYTAKLDEVQFEWLKADLQQTPASTPIAVLSHIPILSCAAALDGENESTGNWTIPGAWMHIDARRIKDLFKLHSNLKLCLSGHLHLQDRVEYLGIKYLCNGAVCGKWWKGNCQEFPPAYALIDLYEDGSSDEQMVNYFS